MDFKFEDNRFTFKAERKRKLFATPHLHSQVELILVNGGTATAYIDGYEYTATGGDMFVVFPNRVHYYKKSETPNTLILFSPDVCPELSQYLSEFLPKEPVVRDALQNGAVQNAATMLTASAADRFSNAAARGYLLILMSEVLRALTLTAEHTETSDIVKELVLYCCENYSTDISLNTVAKALHVSKYYLSHIFSQLGTGFCEYINSLRIAKACELLKNTDAPISEIALEVGYGSIRTFNRVFLNTVGMTPKAYRRC